MRLRQEQQDGVLLVMQQFRHIIGQIERGGAIMLMRHLHALRRGGRTGRVHNGAQIGLLHGIDSRIERLIAHTGAIRLDLVKTTGLEADDVLQSRHSVSAPSAFAFISVVSTTSRRASELLTILRICSAESVS